MRFLPPLRYTNPIVVLQYIQQQNELVKSLRERMKNYEENLDDGVPKEREVR
jgi:hypothetical protein